MTRSENMKRLWSDPVFRARQSAKASARMKITSTRLWADPEYRAEATQRSRFANRCRWLLHRINALEVP